MSGPLDPRLHPFRDDLAAEYLEGRVDADRFAKPRQMQVCEAAAPVHEAPRSDSEMISQALYGERVDVYDEQEGWAWTQLCGDGYVGYAPAHMLTADCVPATHKVKVPRSFVYRHPDIKSTPASSLTLDARLGIDGEDGDFYRTHDGRFLYRDHVSALDDYAPDFVAVAESMLGAPYLWGGKSIGGIDCSGLVQLACQAAGIRCPRDSDMQREGLGTALPDADISALKRGDLLFWNGHVGIMSDAATLLHATAQPMLTVYEPVGEAVKRIAGAGSELLKISRL